MEYFIKKSKLNKRTMAKYGFKRGSEWNVNPAHYQEGQVAKGWFKFPVIVTENDSKVATLPGGTPIGWLYADPETGKLSVVVNLNKTTADNLKPEQAQELRDSNTVALFELLNRLMDTHKQFISDGVLEVV